MKYIKNFKVFENLESEIDLVELEHILIDFEQMDLDYDIKAGSSIVIDWNLFNDDKHGGPKVLRSNEIDKYTKSMTKDSLTIEFNNSDNAKHTYNITDVEEGYEMLKDYLFDNYDLIPNYIYINYNWGYMYFEDFDKIKELRVTDHWQFAYEKLPVRPENTFKADKLTFGFYKDPDAVFRGPEF
jgi:hypothetical protein